MSEAPNAHRPDTPGAVRDWLTNHPDEAAFTTDTIKAAYPGRGLNTTAISAELRKAMGSFPTLTRTGKTTWTLTPKDPSRDRERPEFRIARNTPLRTGARLEVVGQTGGGVAVARDGGGRLWVLTPLELPA